RTPTGRTCIHALASAPSRPVPVNPLELLASPRLKVLFESLRTQFDFVLIDSPPLLAVTDPCIVVAQVDGVLLGLRLSKDARPLAERAKEILDGLGTPVLGVVINGVHHRPISAGYDYEPLGDYRRPLAYTR